MRCICALLCILASALPAAAQDGKVGNKSLKQWSAALKHEQVKVRYQTLAALHEAGADAAPLAKEVAFLLKDPQAAIRRAAAQVLANLKGDAAPAVPALVAALRDTDYWVRQSAAQALTEIGEPAAAPLISLLTDKDANTRFVAIVAINGLGLQSKEVAQALGKAAKDANATVRSAALFALAKIEGDDAEIFAILGAALGDKEKQVRLSAANILVSKGKQASEALINAADDQKVEQRVLALQTLASLGEEIDEKGVLALRKGLGDDELRVRQTAALGLANLGVKARTLGGDMEMFDALAKLLKDKDAQLRRTAIHALGQLGSSDPAEMKTVAGALKDADALVRSFAVQALTKYIKDADGEEDRKLLMDGLIGALKDADRRVQFLAAQGLAQQTAFAIEPLTKVVEEGKGTQRLWAATILGEIGPGALEAVPALQKMSRDPNADIRRVALLALQKVQAEPK